MGALEHGQAQLRFGREDDLIRNPGLGSPYPIFGPTFRQIKGAVDQRPAIAAGIAQEHADLAVLDPPRRAAILPLHAGRLRALLHKAVERRCRSTIQHQHPAGIAQMLADIGKQIVVDRIGIPAHPAQELLHPVRRPVPRRLRQLPPLDRAAIKCAPPAPATHADTPPLAAAAPPA